MKCPKCHYVSHDYLDACRKCGMDLLAFKHDLGLLVLQPGGLDLSLLLGGAGADDLFESVNDDDFDISLEDYAEHQGIWHAPAGAPRTGEQGQETDEDLADTDHLALELDSSELPADVTAQLRAAQVIPAERHAASDEAEEAASPSAGTNPGFPEVEPLTLEDLDDLAFPGHLTLELDISEMRSDESSIIPDNLQREDLPDDVKSQMSPPDDQRDDAEELLLDLDDLTFDDDEPV